MVRSELAYNFWDFLALLMRPIGERLFVSKKSSFKVFELGVAAGCRTALPEGQFSRYFSTCFTGLFFYMLFSGLRGGRSHQAHVESRFDEIDRSVC